MRNRNFLFEFQKLCQGPSYFAQQWHLRNIGQNGGLMREDMAAREAWDITTGNADIVVAVIDDGVDIEHPARAIARASASVKHLGESQS